jgi:hypothetical protein
LSSPDAPVAEIECQSNLKLISYTYGALTSVAGSIQEEIPLLFNLVRLIFLGSEGTSKLRGGIPTTIGGLPQLTDLGLSIGNMYNLQFKGPIASEVGKLTNLVRLDLGDNDLDGAIPTELVKLTNLTFLELERNILTGTIPTELRALTFISFLDFEDNTLGGTIPTELGQFGRQQA